MRLAHLLHVFGIGLAFLGGIVNLTNPPHVLGIVFLALAAVAFGASFMLQRRRSG
jgi:drug/metabolite transporter (DMT)-like permease